MSGSYRAQTARAENGFDSRSFKRFPTVASRGRNWPRRGQKIRIECFEFHTIKTVLTGRQGKISSLILFFLKTSVSLSFHSH